MEPTDKPSLSRRFKRRKPEEAAALEFLPDADEIERRPLPRSARITLHILATALLFFIVWACLSETDLVVAARGRLVTSRPNIVVQPLDTSIIQSISVQPGQVVKKGEQLAALDPTFTEADEAQLRSRAVSLENQKSRLEAELAGKAIASDDKSGADRQLQVRLAGERQAAYGAQLRRLEENIARVRASLETNRHEQEATASKVRVLREMEAMQNQLVQQKYAVRSRLLEAQDRLIEAERANQLARSREQELRKELAALEAEKQSFQTSWREKTMEELLNVTRDLDSVNEQLQKAGKRRQLVVLTAPSDAVVLDIGKLSVGSVIREAETLFTLVPLGDALEAEVQIDALDVGYLKIGDVAHVKLDAYPFQKHGTLDAELRNISEDAFRRENGGGVDTYYVGRLRLKSTHLNRMAEHARLLPGMTMTAEIVVGKRTIMSYLLWPLVKALDESIREP